MRIVKEVKTFVCAKQKNAVWSPIIYRSNHQRCSIEKGGVLRNFTKITRKRLCQSLFFNKVGAATLLKKRLWHRCFFCEFCEISKNTFFLREPLRETASVDSLMPFKLFFQELNMQVKSALKSYKEMMSQNVIFALNKKKR